MTLDDAHSPDEAAVRWFVILRDEDVTGEQRRAFELWLEASPAHEAAWAEVEKTWAVLDALAPETSPAEVRSGRERADKIARFTPHRAPAPARRSAWRRIAAAAVVLIAIGVGWQSLPVGLWSDYRTSIGERRVVALEDGSEVELSSASALDVDYSAAERKVTLVSGEAFFTVTKDARRPFVVAAKGGEILVRGTAFNVKIAGNVAVSVTESVVDVKAASRAPVRVTQGHGVHYSDQRISAVAEVNIETVQAWRQDQLVFHDVRLADVLAELQRYRRGYIQLLDSDLADRRVTAVFDARRPDAALETIADNLDLRLYRATDFLIGIASN